MDEAASRDALISLLQLAYSGERAAALAYRGHWRSARNPGERARIRRIEEEEWHHRQVVGEILADLGARPDPWREARAVVVGRGLGLLCHLVPSILPMYGAGRLEQRNVTEYETAARHAEACGRADLLGPLGAMAEVERDHEAYFRSKVEGHPLTRLIRLWPGPPPPVRPGVVAGGLSEGGGPGRPGGRPRPG